MNYRVEIKDMENLQDPLVLEYAERGSISLNWLDGSPIRGSELNFSMEVLDGSDGKYIQYFTSDEQKWQVTKYLENTDEIIWRGFLLPESYSEPWDNPTFYPQFSAVDGLGLLRGKKLGDDFYSEEKTVIEIFAAILQLTGIDFDIFFSPAIQNTVVPEWHNIFLDTRQYEAEKRPSAYEILEEILSSLQCEIFQCDARWYIEGINKRHLSSVSFYQYSIDGTYKGTVTVEKNIKKVGWYPVPMITMNPALKEVVVIHSGSKVQFREDVFKEQDIDWVKAPGVILEILPEDWIYNPEYLPVQKAPNYYLELPANHSTVFQENARVSLREKIYVLKDWKIKFSMEFKVTNVRNHVGAGYEYPEDFLTNIPSYQIYLNGKRVLWNILNTSDNPDMVIEYDNDFNGQASFEFYPSETGYMDLHFLSPYDLQEDWSFDSVQVTNLKIETPDLDKETFYTEPIDPKSSQVREITLPISDDISGFSKCFYLDRQREFHETSYFKIAVPIKYSFTQNGNNYHVVSLMHANLIEQFKDYVHYTNRFIYLENLEVIYNFNGGEQMVVKADQLMTGTLYVTVRPYKDPTGDRTDWLKWTDATFRVGEKPYVEVVAEIHRKLFTKPHLMIEGTAAAPVKVNDLVEFNYRGETKYFVPHSISWNPDENESSVTLIEGVYAGNSLGNIPPFVDAGPDIYIDANATSAQITEAVATDSDGYIDRVIWEKISGDPGETYSNPAVLNPLISGLTGSAYEFRLTGFDNLGGKASDTMKIIRVGDYLLILDLVESYDDISVPVTDGDWLTKREKYKLYTSPVIPDNETVTLIFDAKLYRNLANAPRTYPYSGRVLITKNGTDVYDLNRTYQTRQKEVTDDSPSNTLNYIHSDEIFITLEVTLIADTSSSTDEVSAEINFHTSEFKVESAQLSNLPQLRSIGLKMSDYV